MVQVGTGSTGVQLVYYPGTVLQCRSTVEATRVHVECALLSSTSKNVTCIFTCVFLNIRGTSELKKI